MIAFQHPTQGHWFIPETPLAVLTFQRLGYKSSTDANILSAAGLATAKYQLGKQISFE